MPGKNEVRKVTSGAQWIKCSMQSPPSLPQRRQGRISSWSRREVGRPLQTTFRALHTNLAGRRRLAVRKCCCTVWFRISSLWRWRPSLRRNSESHGEGCKALRHVNNLAWRSGNDTMEKLGTSDCTRLRLATNPLIMESLCHPGARGRIRASSSIGASATNLTRLLKVAHATETRNIEAWLMS
jgi:hypothetical protein